MKKLLTPLMVLAGLALLATPALADHHKGKMDHGEKFAKADTDGDGYLTKDEMLAAHQKKIDKMFEKLDADKDGKLSQDELKKGREDMREKMKERMEDRKDKKDAE